MRERSVFRDEVPGVVERGPESLAPTKAWRTGAGGLSRLCTSRPGREEQEA
jgi:hypothetical protein